MKINYYSIDKPLSAASGFEASIYKPKRTNVQP